MVMLVTVGTVAFFVGAYVGVLAATWALERSLLPEQLETLKRWSGSE